MITELNLAEMSTAQKKVTRAALKEMYKEKGRDNELLMSVLEIGKSIILDGDRAPAEIDEFRNYGQRLYDDYLDEYFKSSASMELYNKMKNVKEFLKETAAELLENVTEELQALPKLTYDDFNYYEKVLAISLDSTYMNLKASTNEYPPYRHPWKPSDSSVRTPSSSDDIALCTGLLNEYYCLIMSNADRFENNDEMYRCLLSWIRFKAQAAKYHQEDSIMSMVSTVIEEIENEYTGNALEEALYETYYKIADSSMYRRPLPKHLEYLDRQYFEEAGYDDLIKAVNRCLSVTNRNLKRFPADKEWMRRKAKILSLRADSLYRITKYSENADQNILSEATGSYMEAVRIYLQRATLEESKQLEKLDMVDAYLCNAFIESIKKQHGDSFPVRYPSPDDCVFNVTAG